MKKQPYQSKPYKKNELGSSPEKIRAAALRLLNRKSYLKKELYVKLCQKGGEPEVIENVIESLEESGYLNDEKAAEAIIYSRKNYNVKGRNYVYRELSYKGLDQELAENSLDEYYSEEEELANLNRLLKKEIPKIDQSDQEKRRKQVNSLIRKMCARGFKTTMVLDAIYKMLDADDEFSDYD